MKHKLTSCILMALMLMPTAYTQTNAAFDDEVWVGGVQVTDANKNDVLGDGGSVKYDPATDTLTLTDATITNENGNGIYAYGINLTINGIDTDAEGTNTITGKSVVESGIEEDGLEYTLTTPGHGIYSEGNGYSGNGGIIITGTIGDINAEAGSGIYAYEDIVIKGTVGDISCTDGLKSDFGGVIVEETGVLGNITSEEYNAIEASGDVIIAGKVGNINGNGYSGIHVTGGDVIISGDIERIIGLYVGIEVYNEIDFDKDGNEIYSGGNVTISGKVYIISGSSIGICAYGDLIISGTTEVIAEDKDGNEECAVCAGRIISKENIAEPEEYHIGSVLTQAYADENGPVYVRHYRICDSNDFPAMRVKFEGFKNPFEDVRADDWYYSDMEYAVLNGLFNGTSETTFEPDGNLTRAMLVTVLYRAEGEPVVSGITSFGDLEPGLYYLDAVCWAQVNGIVNGITETEFAPNSNITREQIAAIMHRYAKYKGYDVSVGENTNILSYDDFDSISEYAIASVQYTVGTGLIKGKTESTINPQDFATRAETAAILHRFIEANS